MIRSTGTALLSSLTRSPGSRSVVVVLAVAIVVSSAAVAGVRPTGSPAAAPVDGTDSERAGDNGPPEGLIEASTAGATIRTGNGDDGSGAATASGDVNGDGVPDLLIGAPNASDAGAVYLFYGPVNDSGVALSAADAVLRGSQADAAAGRSIDVADVDGDGDGDVVVGAPGHDGGGPDAGAVYVVAAGADLSGRQTLASVGVRFLGDSRERVGTAVAAREVDSLETVSVVVGAPGGDGRRGGAFVFSLASVRQHATVADADAHLTGRTSGDRAGRAVAWAGPVTGDGEPTVLIGAPGHDGGETEAGAVHVVETPLPETAPLSAADVTVAGVRSGARVGASVSGVDDFDGDGTADLLIGAPGHDRRGNDTGAVRVVRGSDTLSGNVSLPEVAAASVFGEAPGDRLGRSVAGGEFNCDDRADALVGAPGHDDNGRESGAAYLLYGRTDRGQFGAAKFVGPRNESLGGTALAVGDVSGDGVDDVLVGTPGLADETDRTSTLAFRGRCEAASADTDRTGLRERADSRGTIEESDDSADATSGSPSEEERVDRGDGGEPDGTSVGEDSRTGAGENADDGSRREGGGGTPSTQPGTDDGTPRETTETGPAQPPDDEPSDTGSDPDDESPGTPGEQTQRQSVVIDQTQCQSQRDGRQTQEQNQSVSIAQDGTQIGESGTIQGGVQNVDVRQRQCQYQNDSRRQQRQHQRLLIEFARQSQRQGPGETSQQTQIQTSRSTQRQQQFRNGTVSRQTQVQVFEVSFFGAQFQPVGGGPQQQRQSQSIDVEQEQSQSQRPTVDQQQTQSQRVSVIYEGQTQRQTATRQRQSQSANASQVQRQQSGPSGRNQTQSEYVETNQRQEQRQNDTNVTGQQAQNQSIGVDQSQEQTQGTSQQQTQGQSVNATQEARENGTGEQSQNQSQETTLAQTQTQNLTSTESEQTQNGSATVEQTQNQTQTGNGSQQRQEEVVTAEQRQQQTQSEPTRTTTTPNESETTTADRPPESGSSTATAGTNATAESATGTETETETPTATETDTPGDASSGDSTETDLTATEPTETPETETPTAPPTPTEAEADDAQTETTTGPVGDTSSTETETVTITETPAPTETATNETVPSSG